MSLYIAWACFRNAEKYGIQLTGKGHTCKFEMLIFKSAQVTKYCHFQTTMTFEHLFHVNILHRLNEQSNNCRQQVPLDTR